MDPTICSDILTLMEELKKKFRIFEAQLAENGYNGKNRVAIEESKNEEYGGTAENYEVSDDEEELILSSSKKEIIEINDNTKIFKYTQESGEDIEKGGGQVARERNKYKDGNYEVNNDEEELILSSWLKEMIDINDNIEIFKYTQENNMSNSYKGIWKKVLEREDYTRKDDDTATDTDTDTDTETDTDTDTASEQEHKKGANKNTSYCTFSGKRVNKTECIQRWIKLVTAWHDITDMPGVCEECDFVFNKHKCEWVDYFEHKMKHMKNRSRVFVVELDIWSLATFINLTDDKDRYTEELESSFEYVTEVIDLHIHPRYRSDYVGDYLKTSLKIKTRTPLLWKKDERFRRRVFRQINRRLEKGKLSDRDKSNY